MFIHVVVPVSSLQLPCMRCFDNCHDNQATCWPILKLSLFFITHEFLKFYN